MPGIFALCAYLIGHALCQGYKNWIIPADWWISYKTPKILSPEKNQCKMTSPSLVSHLLYPPHNEVVGGGILVSLRPSVCPSVRPSVPRPSRIPCPLCSFYSSGWIHFIFLHLIKQLQKVCPVQSFLQNFKIWNFGNFLKSVTLTLCCFDLGSDVNH